MIIFIKKNKMRIVIMCSQKKQNTHYDDIFSKKIKKWLEFHNLMYYIILRYQEAIRYASCKPYIFWAV